LRSTPGSATPAKIVFKRSLKYRAMGAPVLCGDLLDLRVRLALRDTDVRGEVGELALQRFELAAPLCVALNEDVAVEARLDLQREARRPVEQPLRIIGGEIWERERAGGRVLFAIPSCGAVAGAGECVDVRLTEGLVLQCGGVLGEVLADHVQLCRGPVPSEAVGRTLCCWSRPPCH
jgi:hypothetical protein